MDAEQRHELKRNELAEALSRLKDWREIDRSWFLLAGVILVAILTYIAVQTWSWAAEQSENYAWAQYQQLSRAPGPDGLINTQELRTAADGGLSSNITPLAKLELAEILSRNAAIDSTNQQRLLEEAQSLVQSALALVDGMKTPVLYASALMTQASLHESLSEFDAARTIYEKLQEPRFAGSPFTTPLGVGTSFEQPSLVEQRLENLEEVQAPVTMLAGLPPSEAAALPNVPGVPDLSSLGTVVDLDAETNAQAEQQAADEAETAVDTPVDETAEEAANEETEADSAETDAAAETPGADEQNAP